MPRKGRKSRKGDESSDEGESETAAEAAAAAVPTGGGGQGKKLNLNLSFKEREGDTQHEWHSRRALPSTEMANLTSTIEKILEY